MHITINDIKGEKTIDLSYQIHPRKEIAVVSMHISNSQILLNVVHHRQETCVE